MNRAGRSVLESTFIHAITFWSIIFLHLNSYLYICEQAYINLPLTLWGREGRGVVHDAVTVFLAFEWKQVWDVLETEGFASKLSHYHLCDRLCNLQDCCLLHQMHMLISMIYDVTAFLLEMIRCLNVLHLYCFLL